MDTQAITEIPPPHGHKRPAEDSLESEQRLAKRFNLLNLGTALDRNASQCVANYQAENIGKLYIPKPQPTAPLRRSRSNAFSDSMNVDDTRDRIYIHNLDDEISDAESEGERLVFLPDIEKRLTKIPNSVLTSQSQPLTSNEVVLYGVPESISIPREKDNVRKAIIESRERARQKQLQAEERTGSQHADFIVPDVTVEKPVVYSGGIRSDPVIDIYDEDAMDIG